MFRADAIGAGRPALAASTAINCARRCKPRLIDYYSQAKRNNVIRAVVVQSSSSSPAASTEPERSVVTSEWRSEIQEVDLGCRTDFSDLFQAGAELGSGAFGKVRIAVHKASGKNVAVKTMFKVRGKLTREKTLQKIRREINFMTSMQDCPGVVRLLGCFEDHHQVHMVTELCVGGELRKYCESRGPLDEPTLAAVAFQCTRFLKFCHDHGIQYGDVKPANICLVEPRPKSSTSFCLTFIDFGTAQPAATGDKRLSKRCGTFSFMAPEVFSRSYSIKADIWSMGVMLYWLFCQRYPFWDTGEPPIAVTLEQVQQAVSTYRISFDRGVWQDMSPEGLDFIQRCMDRQEDTRWTAEQLMGHPWLASSAATLECATPSASLEDAVCPGCRVDEPAAAA